MAVYMTFIAHRIPIAAPRGAPVVQLMTVAEHFTRFLLPPVQQL